MGTILIVEDDWSLAQRMAALLRSAGHTPVLAADARAALRAAELRPDAIVLDLGLPDVPGEDLLAHLCRIPETARATLVVVTGNAESAARLVARKPPGLADVVMKPVDGRRLSQAVQAALANSAGARDVAVPSIREVHRRDVIFRLIAQGPDRLASHVYRRLCVDRSRPVRFDSPRPLEWPQIAQWALLEGLVDEDEAGLIAGRPAVPPAEESTGTPTRRKGATGTPKDL